MTSCSGTTPIPVLVLDTGKEWGGGTNSLLELLKRIDRSRFGLTACFYQDYPKGGNSSLSRELSAIGIPLILLGSLTQPLWAKIAKELVRGLLWWNRSWRNRAVFAIEHLWRINPRARQVAELVRKGGYALLYLNNQPSSNREGYLAAHLAGIPVVQHCRIEACLNKDEVDVTNRLANAVICVSHGVEESLREQGIHQNKLHVVPNAIDGDQPLPTPIIIPGLSPDALVIGTVGSLIKRKSVDQLLKAVALLKTSVPIHVVVVGEGPELPSLHALARQLGIAERVLFPGFQPTPLPWMAAMDLVVLASAKEGLPRVLLEAMLLSKPVVASRVVGSKELVVEGETGFLYDYGDEQTLAARLQLLIDDATLRARLGQAGRQRVLGDYSIGRYVSSVEEILAAAVGRGVPP